MIFQPEIFSRTALWRASSFLKKKAVRAVSSMTSNHCPCNFFMENVETGDSVSNLILDSKFVHSSNPSVHSIFRNKIVGDIESCCEMFLKMRIFQSVVVSFVDIRFGRKRYQIKAQNISYNLLHVSFF